MADGWRVVQRTDGLWQVVCPVCGNRGGNYQTREMAVEIAKKSAELHEMSYHK